MFRTFAICVLAGLACPMPLRPQQVAQVQIEQSRQNLPLPGTVDLDGQRNAPDFPTLSDAASTDDAFGAQLILKHEEAPRPFTAFAEIGAFVTNNVALARRARQQDQFLVASAGAAWSRPLPFDLGFDARVSGSAYRYDKFRELDFRGVDLSFGLTWTPPQLRGAEILARYAFTDLTSADGGDDFYKNHAALLGLQKVVPFSRAQAVYFGATAQWSWADPAEATRDEYVGYAGYRLAVTRAWSTDLYYRYGRYIYREAAGRQDNNHTLSFTLRYAPTPWAALSTTSFLAGNRSNREAFDYDVINLGAGLQFALKF